MSGGFTIIKYNGKCKNEPCVNESCGNDSCTNYLCGNGPCSNGTCSNTRCYDITPEPNPTPETTKATQSSAGLLGLL